MGTTNKSSCKTAAVMNLLGRGPAADQDVRVLPDEPRDIEIITSEILNAKQRAGEAILTIGHGLIEAKGLLSHGAWLSWLAERVEFSEDTAENYMKLARKYSNSETLRNLGYSKALALLSLPDKTREEFIEATHVVDGVEKTVADMSTRELKAALKERDEALKAAEQAKADQKAADQAREKLSQDMALANERIAGLSAEVEELRSRPVEVAVQADESAVEAARKEAEERMRAQLDRAKKAQAKAEKARKAAEEDRAEAQKELERTQAEAKALREQAETAQKKAALTSNEDLMLFRTLFDQVQEQINKLGGVLMKVRNRDPDSAENLSRALLALCEKIMGVTER